MKIAILGASGLVGWNLLQKALTLGHKAIGTCHAHPQPGLVPLAMDDPRAVLSFLGQYQPESIFYCAGWTWVDGCEADPERARRENIRYPLPIAQFAAETGSHVTYFSTSYVFDGQEGPYTEEAKVCPLSVYGQAKYEAEQEILGATSGKALIARTMGVYGPEPQAKNFVYQVRRTLAEGRPFRVPHDQFGNVTCATDLARMALSLASQKEGGIWNLAGPDPNVRRSDFARHIARCYHLPEELVESVETASLQQPAPRPRQGGLIIDKVVRATGISPQSWVMVP